MTAFFVLAGIHLKENVQEALRRAGVHEVGVAEKMCGYMVSARSDNTVHKYYGSFKRWQEFCKQNCFTDMPAEPVHVAVYLTKLLDAGSSHHVISSVIYGIKWAHDMNGSQDPTGNAFIRNLHESAKRVTGHKTVKKDVVTANMLIELCDKFNDSDDVLLIRDLCMITTAFTGFLRYDELSSIHCNDLTFHPDHLTIDIIKSKND